MDSRLIIPEVEYVIYQEETDELVTYKFVSNTSLVVIGNKDFVAYTLLFKDFKARYDGCYDLGEL